MIRFLLPLRFVMLAASLGAAVGALVMFWLGASKTVEAVRAALGHDAVKSAIGSVMGATDAFLFGVVLVIFAYAIAFGFVVELPPDDRGRLPAWMRVEGVAGLKRILVEVILVYLIVDFATDVAEAESHLDWHTLVMPASILLIAGALRLMSHGPPGPAPSEPDRASPEACLRGETP
ncbi:MAG TPA: YqhA family protein [Beijerinckiaceae bacterium]|jgi:uncharacterized membrane protein YqhA